MNRVGTEPINNISRLISKIHLAMKETNIFLQEGNKGHKPMY